MWLPAKPVREPHEEERQRSEQRHLEKHPGSEVMRELEDQEEHGSRQRKAVFVMLLPQPRPHRFFTHECRHELPLVRVGCIRTQHKHERDPYLTTSTAHTASSTRRVESKVALVTGASGV